MLRTRYEVRVSLRYLGVKRRRIPSSEIVDNNKVHHPIKMAMKATIRNLWSTLLLLQLCIIQCISFSTQSSSSSSSQTSSSGGQRVFVSTPTKSTNRIVSDLMTSQPHVFTLSPHTPVDQASEYLSFWMYNCFYLLVMLILTNLAICALTHHILLQNIL